MNKITDEQKKIIISLYALKEHAVVTETKERLILYIYRALSDVSNYVQEGHEYIDVERKRHYVKQLHELVDNYDNYEDGVRNVLIESSMIMLMASLLNSIYDIDVILREHIIEKKQR